MRFFPPGRAEPDHIMLDIEGRPVRVEVRRNARARRYTLRLAASGGNPVLTIPDRGTFKTASTFAEDHRGWLADSMKKMPEAQPFCAGGTVPLRGVPHLIDQRPTARGTVRTEKTEEGLSLVVCGEEPYLARRLTDYLKREARRDLSAAVEHHATTLARLHATNRKPTGLSIRDTRSRWGSCTAKGKLNFSWRLILAPPFVLDYVAAHEVAHLVEMNHSDRFWAVTHDLFAETERARKWLRRYGNELHSYG
ncbi:SprT family zinc-dependent metalloprotease [Breoghania sp.]|uniref:M48 family metallopeptidase n=1 Tax=Breoghania sp. TaxID=2065378 RepID=UPI00261BB52C|nr:SprT family zinc-dependent metalloprotease [Breoghania sp.]MDJ0930348.1 SprT family zinc-dependent metalloprotease [Breoghania sp.]